MRPLPNRFFKLWVKDPTIDTVSSGLIDLIGTKTSDIFTQREGERQFKKIGDKISKEILPIFEKEGASLDEGECNAVALAVATALNNAKLSRDALLEHNLQPQKLEQTVLHTCPNATRDFSEIGTALYLRLIKEASIYIVDIASHFPSFTEHAFAEVLKREDYIVAIVNDVLNELHRMRELLDPSNEIERFEKEYREAVARNLDILQLIGADVSLPNRRHQLSVAYISLSALQQRTHHQTNLPTFHDKLSEQTRNIVSVETTLAFAQRLLILGPAGSGKTTLLQWIAVRTATRTFKEPLRDWNDCLPFYIRLRQYVTSVLPQPEKFPAFAAPSILGEMPLEWVHNVLRSGRAILLVDGVDEMSAARREEVQTWLRDLIETYRNCRFIVTSRPHAMEAGWMNHNPFEIASLQEMTLSDIYSFVDHWHEAVRQELLSEEEKSELLPLAEHLKGYIRQTRALRNLATNPLLCAMLCALHRERRQQLPVNRIELYQACSSLLLERREKDRRIDLSDYPVLTYSQKERLLTNLSYWMTKKNLSEAEVSEVDTSFTQLLTDMPGIPSDTTGKAVRRLFVERSGLIREPIVGQIDFAHRTFQEFFTALASVNSMRYLITHAHLDQWREVIILTAGLVRKTLCEQLIKGLLQRGDKEIKYRYQLHLLAMSCLETAIELGEEMRREIEVRFSQLIPPKNMAEAKALATAGELILKHLDMKQLSTKGKLLVTTCAACVRTLALIGGEATLDILEEYTLDTRKMVTDELLLAWDRFERESYARRILARALRSKNSIHLKRLSSLEGISCLPNLAELSLSDTLVSDLSPLTSLLNLTTLSLDGTQVSDLSPLTSLPNLELISLSNFEIG